MRENKYVAFIQTPIGNLKIIADDNAVTEILFDAEKTSEESTNKIIEQCKRELAEYFVGKRKEFTVPLNQKGSEFQKKVWDELQKIPYGKTVSYGYVAEKIGGKNMMRAVGGANKRNRIPIIVPCHRVIGSNGSLVGYAGGLWRKEWLLEHERKWK